MQRLTIVLAALMLSSCASQRVCPKPRLESVLAPLVNSKVRDCGFVRYGESRVPLARCAIESLERLQSFRAFWGAVGIDSFLTKGLVLTRDGRLLLVLSDCDYECDDCPPRIEECTSAEIIRDGRPHIICRTERDDIGFP